jgi:hypothetical protein
MTAIDAAIVELEAHREHVSAFITGLRRLARAMEDAHAPVDPRPAVTAPEPVAPPAPTRDHQDAFTIRKLLLGSEDPMSTPDIVRASRLPVDRARAALKWLVKNLDVRATGATSARRYEAIRPRQGTAAGTQAAPPVGPSPANGTPTRDQVLVVWNGTKERNGDAPSILPPRERRP